MPEVKVDTYGNLRLAGTLLQRRHSAPEGKYWLAERDGNLVLHSRLPDVRKLYIETTTSCNLRCRTCMRNAWGDPEAQMSMGTFQHLVASLDGLPDLKRVVFGGFGEPLIHPHIIEMIEAMRKRALAVTISTNGLLLHPPISRELVRLGVDRLVVSVDGVKPETYAGIRGAILSEVLGNIASLNEIKGELGSLNPSLIIEFVALQSNIGELPELSQLAAHLNAARVVVSNILPYTEDMRSEVLYGYEPRPPLKASGWPVKADAWVLWGTLELPRMHWGAERRCRFVRDGAVVVGWDGSVLPCYALSHNYEYIALDGRKKQVGRYLLGNVNEQPLAESWMSEDFVLFRSEVRGFHFPSCPDCDLRETCDLRGKNEGCWGWNPSCADCLWAQDIVRCP